MIQGADIPDIVRVIQFGAPSSLTVWIQRAGRAGRSPDIDAFAVMFVESSAFTVQNARKTQGHQGAGARPPVRKDPEKASGDSEDINLKEGQEYKKKIEKSLRDWLTAEGCRREVSDTFFNNPERNYGRPVRCFQCLCSTRKYSRNSARVLL